MDAEQPFIDAILAAPTDADLRLIYADWLEERGDPRGEYLRVLAALDGLAPDDPRAGQLRQRLDALQDKIDVRWRALLARRQRVDLVRDCRVEPARLAALAGAMLDRRDGGASDPDWPGNPVSRRAIAYSCGMLGRPGDSLLHEHDQAELDRCRQFSGVAADTMSGAAAKGGNWDVDCAPFFVASNVGAEVPPELTEGVLRRAFGGTIDLAAELAIGALGEQGDWWEWVTPDPGEGAPAAEGASGPWRALVRWFGRRERKRQLHGASFVALRMRENRDWCYLPWLALGITQAGSLVGVGGVVIRF